MPQAGLKRKKSVNGAEWAYENAVSSNRFLGVRLLISSAADGTFGSASGECGFASGTWDSGQSASCDIVSCAVVLSSLVPLTVRRRADASCRSTGDHSSPRLVWNTCCIDRNPLAGNGVMSGYLFVYGSLLPALAPPQVRHLVAGLHSLGPATTGGRLHDLGSYPGLVLDRGTGRVHGQVFELSAQGNVLEALDAYEGYDVHKPKDSLFARVLRPVCLGDREELEAWVYVFQGPVPQATLIPDGDYLAWRQAITRNA
jgi:gamma-glutamylcyclotransferase (GGCT)/AIG2-like uncharacterized protein YtfP